VPWLDLEDASPLDSVTPPPPASSASSLPDSPELVVAAGGAPLACGGRRSGAGVDGLKALEGGVLVGCLVLRHAVGGAGWRWRSPLQDFLQVKVGVKMLDIGEDPRPCESQELPALSVDEL
jgi:hypothetical protein